MWKFYTFKYLVMPTTDSSTPVQTSRTASQVTPQTDEFDLGITQTSVQGVPEETAASLSENLENADQSENQTFDFSLDLPENYSDSSAQEQTPISQKQDSEVQKASEEPIAMPSSQAMEENHFLQEGGDALTLHEEDLQEGVPVMDVSSEEWLIPEVSNTMDTFEEPLQEEASLNLEDATPSMELSEETVWEVVPADEGFLLSQNQDASSTSSVSDSLESELPQQENIQEEETAAQPSEIPVQEVSSSLALEKEESNKVLNLDEMVSQFSSNHSQNIAQAEMDPFSAMKATLEAQEIQKNSSAVQSDASSLATEPTPVYNLESAPFEVESSALQQSSRVQQETNGVSNDQLVQSSSEVQNQISSSAPQTLDLDTLASMPSTIGSSNPLTAPVDYPQQVNQTSAWNKKGIFITLASVVLFVAVGVMMYIKYPDLFTFSGFNPSWSLTGLVAQNAVDEEHGAAPESPLTWDAQLTGDDMLSDNEITPIEPQEISGDFVEEEWSGSIQTIDLTQWDSSADISTETPTKNENSESTSSLSDSSKDPLSSVESLVGPINNNDVIKQEIAEYQRKGTELKEMGTAQNKRIMIKYGLAVEKEAQKILDDLANGGNIDISTWSSLKTKLDGYLAKASNV